MNNVPSGRQERQRPFPRGSSRLCPSNADLVASSAAEKLSVPSLGLGIGWRPEIALAIDRRSDLGFIEVMAEDIDPQAALPEPIERLRERGLAVIPHGVSLSLGGADPPDKARLERLALLASRLNSPLVSEHLAFVRAGGLETGHLLPVARSRESLDVVVANVREARAALPVPLALENIASLFEWPDAEMDEAEFLSEVLVRSDVLLLLDIENVYANAVNRNRDPAAFLDRIPLERIAYVHVAGGSTHCGFYHDSHTDDVPPGVLELLTQLAALADLPGVMLERDGKFPPDAKLNAELDAIALAVERGRGQRLELCKQ
jgi:uncharacterized protein (UPF0276 family)